MIKYKFLIINIIYLFLFIISVLLLFNINQKLVVLGNKDLAFNENLSISNTGKSINIQKQMQLFFVREELVKLLKVYSVYDGNGPLKLVRHGREYDGGYVAAVKSFDQSDVLLGYGINTDNSFEDQFSLIYNKPSYGFDCGIDHIDSKSNLFTLVKECIASDSFLYNRADSNNRVTSFQQQLKNLKLEDKKIFIKMDIEGAEYDALPEIMKYKNNITGISLEIHFGELQTTKKALNLLKQIDKDFVLIHVHGNNNCKSRFETSNSIGQIPSVIELSYINKSLVTYFTLSEDQSHPLDIDQPNIRYWPDVKFKIID